MLMTPRELECAYNGYRIRMDENWEMVRYSSYYSMIMHSEKGKLELKDIFIPPDAMKPKEQKSLTPDMMMKVKKRSDG